MGKVFKLILAVIVLLIVFAVGIQAGRSMLPPADQAVVDAAIEATAAALPTQTPLPTYTPQPTSAPIIVTVERVIERERVVTAAPQPIAEPVVTAAPSPGSRSHSTSETPMAMASISGEQPAATSGSRLGRTAQRWCR